MAASEDGPRVVTRASALALALLSGPISAGALLATPPHPRSYVAYRTTGRINVDGRLDDAGWTRAPWSEPFVDIEGEAKPRPTLPTRVKLLWDDAFLYVGAELEEPHVWATLRDHDAVIFHDNDFELFIDADGDNRDYAEFEINALGTYWDLLLPLPYRDGGKADNSWEIPGIKTAVHVDGTINDSRDIDRGWSVELALPWAVLGAHTARPAPPRDGDQWRVNFSRVEWSLAPEGSGYRKVDGVPEHNWVWSPQGAVDMHRPEMWGYVQFSTKASGTDAFVPDASWPARAWLYDAYYAQRLFRQTHGRYAATLAAAGIAAPAAPLSAPSIVTDVETGYQISVVITLPSGERQRWQVNQRSALRVEPAGGG